MSNKKNVISVLSFFCKLTLHFVTLDHKPVLSRWGIFVAIAKKYTVWDKIIDFSFMPKIIRILVKIMFHEDILQMSYFKYIKT